MKIIKQDGVYIIQNIFHYGDIASLEKKNDYIYLDTTIGEAMRYDKHQKNHINFPGEYDIHGNFIKAFTSKGELNYHIKTSTKVIGIVNQKSALDHNIMDKVDHWIVSEKKIQEALEKMEIEGEVTILSEIA